MIQNVLRCENNWTLLRVKIWTNLRHSVWFRCRKISEYWMFRNDFTKYDVSAQSITWKIIFPKLSQRQSSFWAGSTCQPLIIKIKRSQLGEMSRYDLEHFCGSCNCSSSPSYGHFALSEQDIKDVPKAATRSKKNYEVQNVHAEVNSRKLQNIKWINSLTFCL